MEQHILSQDEIRQVQLITLELLVEVDRICKKCGIQYNIIAGTILGAVRHGGYIPWDDDADVALLRNEYEKFRDACKTELNTEKYYFQDHTVTPGYRWGYGKLRKKGTQFVRLNQEHMPYDQGVFIDVFPMDYIPNNKVLRTFKNFECFCVRKLLWSKIGKDIDSSLIKRCIYTLLDKVDERRALKLYENIVRSANKKQTEWVRILMFPTPNREYGYKAKWYANSSPIMFEGVCLSGVSDYDGYLSFKFGDYMNLPPVEQRKIHPVSIFKV